MATTALTLHPPENFNLAINGQIRQTAKFPVIQYLITMNVYRTACMYIEITCNYFLQGTQTSEVP